MSAAPPVMAGPGPSETAGIRRAASWLEERIERFRASTQAEPPEQFRLVSREIRELLLQEGVEEELADALLPRPPADRGEQARAGQLRDLEATRQRLIAFAEAAERPPPETPAGARAILTRILEDPIFKTRASKPGFLQGQLNKLRSFVGWIMTKVFGFVSGHGSLIIWVVAVTSIAALVFFIVRFAALLLGRRWLHEPPGYLGVRSLRRLRAQDPKGLLSSSRKEFEAGRLVAAMKLLEQAAILSLQQRRLLPDRPGLTDLESVELLREQGPSDLHADFERLAELHDQLVYAGREITTAAVALAEEIAARIVLPPEEEPA